MRPGSLPPTPASRSTQGTSVLLTCLVVVLTFYVWLASVGSWTRWPSLSERYDQLASAFLKGQLALPLKPDPALLALSNPYDPVQRQGVDFPLDMSFYGGKFYLYFGPVPGLILAVAKLAVPGQIGDAYLVFAFISGLFIVQSLFAHAIWKRYFHDVSLWAFGTGLLFLGLAAPSGWLLSTPQVYNAAVMSGAFFFAAGLYSAYGALEGGSTARWKLIMAGALWAAAVGSRITQVVPVVLLTVLVTAKILTQHRKAGQLGASIGPLLALFLPLAIGGAALGWYNWARFGSVFETGFTYALSGGFQAHLGEIFSPLYIPQNAANYLFAPPDLRYAFPYFQPAHGYRESVIAGFPLPDIYWTSPIVGLLITTPFILFSIVSLIHAVRTLPPLPGSDQDQRSLRSLSVVLWIAFLSSFLIFLSFFWSAERYTSDFIPAWCLLSVIGFWQLGRSLSRNLAGRLVYVFLGLGLLVVTALISNLLALSFNADGFRALNPVLWRQLGNLFRP